jgi:hypothetical protein
MKDVTLPFGIPTNLSIPLNINAIKHSTLRSFAESSIDEFILLDGEYSAKLEEIGRRLQENWDSLHSTRAWTPKDSALLFYIITALEDLPMAGFKHELLGKLFPNFGDDQVC